jgi:Putative transposase of IS4/5 family (DUF4096)
MKITHVAGMSICSYKTVVLGNWNYSGNVHEQFSRSYLINRIKRLLGGKLCETEKIRCIDITDAQLAFLGPLFRPKRRKNGRARPWRDIRAVMNGVLWVLRTCAHWQDLPGR